MHKTVINNNEIGLTLPIFEVSLSTNLPSHVEQASQVPASMVTSFRMKPSDDTEMIKNSAKKRKHGMILISVKQDLAKERLIDRKHSSLEKA